MEDEQWRMEDGEKRERRRRRRRRRKEEKETKEAGGEVGSGVELNGRSTANTELDHRQYGKTVVRMIRNYAGDAEKTEEVGKR